PEAAPDHQHPGPPTQQTMSQPLAPPSAQWQSGPMPLPYRPTGSQQPAASGPPKRRTSLAVGLCVGGLAVVGLVVGAVLAFGPDSAPDSSGSTPPTDIQAGPAESADPSESTDPAESPENYYEDTAVTDLEHAVVGGLSTGDCFDQLPDLTDALRTPMKVTTVACTSPHLSQVVGFVNIADIDASDDTGGDRAGVRCGNLMVAMGVPEGAEKAARAYFPNQETRDAGVGVAMCAVTGRSGPWTGSLLDGTATGF
ncbi:MAG: hypothetical protein FWD11_09225, partial [Micrococcales bacterium]|nr:hypothetical protein [Micrococcales bacterium]